MSKTIIKESKLKSIIENIVRTTLKEAIESDGQTNMFTTQKETDRIQRYHAPTYKQVIYAIQNKFFNKMINILDENGYAYYDKKKNDKYYMFYIEPYNVNHKTTNIHTLLNDLKNAFEWPDLIQIGHARSQYAPEQEKTLILISLPSKKFIKESIENVTEIINVGEDPYEAFEIAKKEGWIDDNETLDDFDVFSLFEGDPDMIKINGTTGYFMSYNHKILYVSTSDDANNEIEDLLRKFYSEDFKSYFTNETPQTWENYDSEDFNGIAYRGGSGYVYTIWKYINE